MRLAVTGSRECENREFVFRHLDWWHWTNRITVLLHGGATGVDNLARLWAEERELPCLVFPVSPNEWREYGKAAGPRRNLRMLRDGQPDWLLAFPGFAGTFDCMRKAIMLRINVHQVYFGHDPVTYAWVPDAHR